MLSINKIDIFAIKMDDKLLVIEVSKDRENAFKVLKSLASKK